MATRTVKRSELPIRQPLVIQIGDDFVGPALAHKNPDGTAVNLTGFVVQGKLQKPDGTTIDLVFIRDDAAGKYTPTLPRATTAALAPGTGIYDIDVIDTLDRKTTYWGGPVTIKKTVP